MITVEKLEEIPKLSGPIALTIGTYDGVHLGHQHLFQELKKKGTAVILTFSNHPADVLRPETKPNLIDTLQQKLRRFETQGIDLVIVLPFTPELSTMSYDAFIKKLHAHLPFTHIIQGVGTVMGHKAQGTQANIEALGKELNFEATYLPKFTHEGEVVSSRKIRELISSGNFEQAFRLLGRLERIKV